VFSANTAADVGGGVSVGGLATLVVRRTTFDNNRAVAAGGGLHFDAGDDLYVQQCSFVGNSVDQATTALGGGAFVDSRAVATATPFTTILIHSTTIYNNEFPNNPTQSGQGSGLYLNLRQGPPAVASVINCILWRDGVNAFSVYYTPSFSLNNPSMPFSHNDWAGAVAAGAVGTNGTLEVSPLLRSVTYPRPAGQQGPTTFWVPPASSAVVDAGVNTGGDAADIRGLARVVGAAADIGAAENQAPILAANLSATLNEDTVLNVPAPGVLGGAVDADLDPIKVSVVPGGAPNNGTLTLAADGSLQYVPNPNYFGTDGFVIQASDGGRFSAPQRVTLTVGECGRGRVWDTVVGDFRGSGRGPPGIRGSIRQRMVGRMHATTVTTPDGT
jgi:hypothetical protein